MAIYYMSEIFTFLLCGLVALLSWWYIQSIKSFDYWKKQNIPGVKPRLIIGTFKPIWKKNVEQQDVEAMKQYGHLHGGFEGSKPILFISDPELLKQIFIKDFNVFSNRRVFHSMQHDKLLRNMLFVMKDEQWKTVRNTLTPTYTTGKLKQMVHLIEECSTNLLESLRSKSENEEPIEFTRTFTILTLDVIASCAFGMKADCITNPESEFVLKAQKAFRTPPVVVYFAVLFNVIFTFLPDVLPNPFKYFAKIADRAIDMRLEHKNVRRDFLQIMLEAEIPEDETSTHLEETTTKKTLTREIVVSQTVLFLLAGHETTATTLTLMAYELAVNQDIQEKLIQEVDDMLSESKGKIDYENVTAMKYLDMVVSETLRKYPPAVRADRVCSIDGFTIKDAVLRKGMMIIIPIYAIHHNPEFYPDPEKFDPERFSAENKSNRNPFTYIPFGAGPRNCIAMRFALLEIKLVMVRLLSNYRLQTCEDTEFPVNFGQGTGLLQPTSIKLTLQKRVD